MTSHQVVFRGEIERLFVKLYSNTKGSMVDKSKTKLFIPLIVKLI